MHRRVCLIIVRRVIPFHFDQQIHIDRPDAVPTVGPNPSEYCLLKIFMWSYFSDEPSLFRRRHGLRFGLRVLQRAVGQIVDAMHDLLTGKGDHCHALLVAPPEPRRRTGRYAQPKSKDLLAVQLKGSLHLEENDNVTLPGQVDRPPS